MKNNFSSPLRFVKWWLSIGWSLVIAVIVLSLMPSPPMPSWDYSDTISHIVAYFVLMAWFAQIYHAPRLRLYYMVGFILLGILLEILQGVGGIRQMDWADMLANGIGVLMAWQLIKNRSAHVLAYFEQKCCG